MGDKIKVSKEEVVQMRKVFDFFDKQQKNRVSLMCLSSMLKLLNQSFTDAMVKRLCLELDKKESGFFTFEDFIKVVVPKMTLRNRLIELRNVFDVIDRDKKGYISAKDLRHIMELMGDKNLDKSRIQWILKESDVDGDGKVTFDDFYKIMATK